MRSEDRALRFPARREEAEYRQLGSPREVTAYQLISTCSFGRDWRGDHECVSQW